MMINWNKIITLRLLLPFVLGILVENMVRQPLPIKEWLLLPLAVIFIYYTYRRGILAKFWQFGLTASLLLSLIGYQLANRQRINLQPDFLGHHLTEQPVELVGTVEEAPIFKNGSDRFVVKVVAVRAADTVREVSGRVSIYARRDSTLRRPPAYGDRVALRGYVNAIEATGNPHAFDYANHMARENIFHQMFLPPEALVLLDSMGGHAIFRAAYRLRAHFIETLKAHLPDAHSFSVGSALILGYKDEMDPDVREAYAGTGAMHVLAVSGLHVGIIAFLLNYIFNRWLEPRDIRWRLYKLPLVLAGIWAFALLTGLPPSVLRAAAMFSLIVVGQGLSKDGNIYNVLATSALLLLAWKPNLLFNVGFQLSYVAVFGIVYLHPKLTDLWMPDNRILAWVWQLTAVSISAQLFTLPISLYYFHQFPIYFWLSGLVVIPAATGILWSGILLFAFSWCGPLALLFGKFLYGLISLTNGLIFAIGTLPGAVVKGFWLPLWVVPALYLSYVGFMRTLYNHRVRGLLFGMAMLIAVGVHYSFTAYRQVQQQDLVVYQTGKGILIDCFRGNELSTLKSGELDPRSEEFAARNNRWQRSATKQTTVVLDSTDTFQNGYLSYRSGALSTNGHTLVLAADTPDEVLPSADFVLIGKDFSGNFSKISHTYPTARILLAAELPYRTRLRWIDELEAARRPYYDLKKEGAFILSASLEPARDE